MCEDHLKSSDMVTPKIFAGITSLKGCIMDEIATVY